MSIHLMIPETVSTADRQQVLARVRRDRQSIEAQLQSSRAGGIVSMSGCRWLMKRRSSLIALERAWVAVQMDGVL